MVCGSTMSNLGESNSRTLTHVHSGRSLKEQASIFSIPRRFLNLESRSSGKWASPSARWRGTEEVQSLCKMADLRRNPESLPILGALPSFQESWALASREVNIITTVCMRTCLAFSGAESKRSMAVNRVSIIQQTLAEVVIVKVNDQNYEIVSHRAGSACKSPNYLARKRYLFVCQVIDVLTISMLLLQVKAEFLLGVLRPQLVH